MNEKVINVSPKSQMSFAKYSGDYNPVHVDFVYARRSMYGEQVVHGINTVLLALDFFCNNRFNFSLNSISVKFLKPVFLNTDFTIKIISNTNNNVIIHIIANNSICTKIKFQFFSQKKSINYSENILSFNIPNKTKPELFDYDVKKNRHRKIDINLCRDELESTYPYLVTCFDNYQFGVILTLTNIVGMKCPGLNSLFSSFKLNFKSDKLPKKAMTFEVNNYDSRFSLYDINVSSNTFLGTIIAFNRPKSVLQSNYNSYKSLVKEDEFSNQIALIIGGSRGIGEITAKILAIGGADVTITYNKGHDDSDKIVRDINSNGGQCKKIKYDVLNDTLNEVNFKKNYTHIYYYATPFIFSGNKDSFSEKLFTTFSKFYISEFYELVNYFYKRKTLNFFYPSTVALDDMFGNMMEYTLSKSSGEKLIDFLQLKLPALYIYKPRLPRLETDQTVSLFPVINEDPDLIILNHLKKFN